MRYLKVSEAYEWYAEKEGIVDRELTKLERQLALLEFILEEKHVE